MKKTLAAVAVLGAFAGSALAADVTLYGRIDTGFNFSSNSIDVEGVEVVDDQDWGMASSQTTGSRLGIKGTEQISEGLAVGFVLEHGLSSDTGADSDSDRSLTVNPWFKSFPITVRSLSVAWVRLIQMPVPSASILAQ